jgi:hypothetical protein
MFYIRFYGDADENKRGGEFWEENFLKGGGGFDELMRVYERAPC